MGISLAAKKLFDDVEKPLSYLYGRWQDEKEYEDLVDYKQGINKQLEEAGATKVQMVKKPFGFICEIDGKVFQYSISRKGYEYKRIG